MAYKVEITPAAQRTIKKLPKNIQRKLIEIIELLAEEPRPVGLSSYLQQENCIELEQAIIESFMKYEIKFY